MYLNSVAQPGAYQGSVNLSGNFLAGSPVKGFSIAAGDAGIRQTCQIIRQQINLGKQDSTVRETFKAILATAHPQTLEEVSQALTNWVVQNIRYTHDDDMSLTEQGLKWINIHQCPLQYQQCEGVEMIITPPETIQSRRGDCDDLTSLLCSFHELAGMSTKLVVIAADPGDPTQFSHIYFVANINGSWIPIDAVHRSQPWNWELPNPYRKDFMC